MHPWNRLLLILKVSAPVKSNNRHVFQKDLQLAHSCRRRFVYPIHRDFFNLSTRKANNQNPPAPGDNSQALFYLPNAIVDNINPTSSEFLANSLHFFDPFLSSIIDAIVSSKSLGYTKLAGRTCRNDRRTQSLRNLNGRQAHAARGRMYQTYFAALQFGP